MSEFFDARCRKVEMIPQEEFDNVSLCIDNLNNECLVLISFLLQPIVCYDEHTINRYKNWYEEKYSFEPHIISGLIKKQVEDKRI